MEIVGAVVASWKIEMLHFVVNGTTRRINFQPTINEYGTAHNLTFPAADILAIKIGCYDCYFQQASTYK